MRLAIGRVVSVLTVMLLYACNASYAAEPSLDQLYLHFFVSVVDTGRITAAELPQSSSEGKSRLGSRLSLPLKAEGSLDNIAKQTLDLVSMQDAKAKKIIDEFHAQYPPWTTSIWSSLAASTRGTRSVMEGTYCHYSLPSRSFADHPRPYFFPKDSAVCDT